MSTFAPSQRGALNNRAEIIPKEPGRVMPPRENKAIERSARRNYARKKHFNY